MSLELVKRPSDQMIIETLALAFRVHEMTVISWLIDMDLEKASEEAEKEFK